MKKILLCLCLFWVACNSSTEPEVCDGIVDECGVCNGDGIADDACDCDGNDFDECGVCGGEGILDGQCGCTFIDNNEDNIDDRKDDCGICGGYGVDADDDGICDDEDECIGGQLDCSGTCNGVAVYDCSGVCDGSAKVDSCGNCFDTSVGEDGCDSFELSLSNIDGTVFSDFYVCGLRYFPKAY